MAKKRLTELEIKSIVDAEIRSAMGENTGDLASERADAMDYYLGEATQKLTQDNPDRSDVVITTVRDTVEWIMPQIMRTIAQADSVVEFEPVGPEDDQAARQETQAINHIFWRQNEGFLISYSWVKDALLQKNGIVKFWKDDSEEVEEEEYDGLSELALMGMMQDEELEPLEYEVSDIQSIDGQPLYRVKFRRTRKESKIMIDVVPPEEFLISADARSIDIQNKMPRFVGHYCRKTRNELKEMGFSDDDIEKMRAGDEKWNEYDEEWSARHHLSDEQIELWSANTEDNEEIVIVEGYMQMDINGDGFSEKVKIWRSGDFVETEEVDNHPFVALTPNILTHKFFGLSIADMVSDLQEISTATMRNVLDNMYMVNNTRPVANERVDYDSLATSRPGAPIYIDDANSVQDALTSFAPPPMWKDGLGMLEYVDGIRKDRTGVGDETMGLEPDSLANANTGVMLAAIEAARGKIELIARIFAETGFKWLFRGIHELCRKNYDQRLRFRLGNKYVEVDPQEWKRRTNMVVNVGTATGSKQQEQFALQQIAALQEKIGASPMFGTVLLPQNIYQLTQDICDNLGLDGEKYFFNPMLKNDPRVQQLIEAQMPKQGPDPQMVAAQAMAQAESQKAQVALQSKQIDAQIKGVELQLKQQELAGRAELETLKLAQQQELNSIKTETDAGKQLLEIRKQNLETEYRMRAQAIEESKNALQTQVETYKAQLQAATAVNAQMMSANDNQSEAFEQREASYNQAMNAVSQQTMEMFSNFQAALSTQSDLMARVEQIGQLIDQMQTESAKPVMVEYDDDGRITRIAKQ